MFGRAAITLDIGAHSSFLNSFSILCCWLHVAGCLTSWLYGSASAADPDRLFMGPYVIGQAICSFILWFFFVMVALCNRADHYIFIL